MKHIRINLPGGGTATVHPKCSKKTIRHLDEMIKLVSEHYRKNPSKRANDRQDAYRLASLRSNQAL